VTIYCINNISFLQKIKASSPYKFISFTDNLKSIEKFVEEEDNMDNYFNDNNEELKIVKVNEFTLYRVSYIKVNKRKKTNTKSNIVNKLFYLAVALVPALPLTPIAYPAANAEIPQQIPADK